MPVAVASKDRSWRIPPVHRTDLEGQEWVETGQTISQNSPIFGLSPREQNVNAREHVVAARALRETGHLPSFPC